MVCAFHLTVLWLHGTEKQPVEKKFKIQCLDAQTSRETSSISLIALAPGGQTALMLTWLQLLGTSESIIFYLTKLLFSELYFPAKS